MPLIWHCGLEEQSHLPPFSRLLAGEKQAATLAYTRRSPRNGSSVIMTVKNNYNFSSVNCVTDKV